ncbi:MAG: hypothetical protein DLM50_04960 [Candidatus Meridianibacter frigidus]|nr:MAG: hypothetical protein DLM50_04960 [Candidatus Eremiobacteraeota bacterium]
MGNNAPFKRRSIRQRGAFMLAKKPRRLLIGDTQINFLSGVEEKNLTRFNVTDCDDAKFIILEVPLRTEIADAKCKAASDTLLSLAAI